MPGGYSPASADHRGGYPDATIGTILGNSVIIALAALAALAAGATALRYPRVCFGILFLVAAMSRETLETPLGTMRPEKPAVVVVAAVLLAGGRFGSLRHLPRTTQAMCLAFGTYLWCSPFRRRSWHPAARRVSTGLPGLPSRC